MEVLVGVRWKEVIIERWNTKINEKVLDINYKDVHIHTRIFRDSSLLVYLLLGGSEPPSNRYTRSEAFVPCREVAFTL